MRLQPPAPLVTAAALCALALLLLGVVSQRTYAPMNVNQSVSAPNYGPYPLVFVMTQLPPARFTPPCDLESALPNARCAWHLYLADQPYEDRVRLLLHEGGGAQNHPLWVRFGDGPPMIQRPDNPQIPPPGPFFETPRMRTLAIYAAIFAAFGLLVLLRGRDAAAWLGVFCLSLAPFFLNFYGALSPNGMVAAWTAGAMLRQLADFALFAMALVLVAPYLKPRVFNALAVCGAALCAVACAFDVVPKYEGIFRGYTDAWLDASKGTTVEVIELLILGALPLALLTYGWWKARDQHRLRLGIIASVVAIGIAGPIIDGALNGPDHFGEATLLALAIPAGFTYAIPRYHVVDIGFVVNRIVIYALLIGVVSAITALAEVLFEKLAESPHAFFQEFQSSFETQAPIVFLIVLSLNWTHKRLEAFVNQVLFKKRHKALNDLKAFIKRTDFAQSREGLLRGAVYEIGRALGTRGVAIYEKTAGGYRRVESGGAFPALVDEDDPAMWFMRAERGHVFLKHRGSELGACGVAFPMCLRSMLYGAIVCGPRINEEYEGDYAPDELDVMDELSMRLAEQLFALAADDRLKFVNQIASGELAGEALLERAAALRSSSDLLAQTEAAR